MILSSNFKCVRLFSNRRYTKFLSIYKQYNETVAFTDLPYLVGVITLLHTKLCLCDSNEAVGVTFFVRYLEYKELARES